MHALQALALTLSLLLPAGSAFAKRLCFEDEAGNDLVIEGVKNVTKPGRTFPVRGYAVLVGNTSVVPLTGTAVANSAGRVIYGITIYNLLEGTNESVTASWIPETGNAPTHHDTDGDGNVDASGYWDPINCNTVVIP